ncbi:hypothetical protein AB0I28_01760 [Phytomonospora sp. NPDC050363]|uniref:hypothetical protein n=1 Tax=Phytomonospora sp. NPDC050363 TaxID=3155642 RepID=UPI0033C39183
MLIIVFLLSTGLAAGAIALEYVTLDASFVWLWLPAVVIAAGSAAIGIPRIGGRGSYEPSEKAVAAALAAEGGALARITSVNRTDVEINEATLCHITLVVDPEERDAYKTRAQLFVGPKERADYQPGLIKLVARPDDERPEAWLVRKPDRDWRKHIKEFGDSVPEDAPLWLPEKGDKPIGRQPLLGSGGRRRPLRVLLYAIAFVLGVAAPAGVFRDDFTVGAKGVFGDVDSEDFARNWRQEGVVEVLTDKIGAGKVAQLVFEKGKVTAVAPTSPGATVLNVYTYEKGEATRSEEPLQATPEEAAAALYDVGEVDFGKIPGIVEDAMTATGITAPTEIQVMVQRATVGNSPSGAIQIAVNVSDEEYQGSYIADLGGTVVSMYGGRPGSAAEAASAVQ